MRPTVIRYAQDASKDVKIPFYSSLLIETLSHLQILALAIAPVLSALSQSTNPLSQTLYNFLYYFQLFNTVYPFISLGITQAMICIGIVYTLLLLLFSFYFAVKKPSERKLPFINPTALTVLLIFHSRVVFYFLHSFCIRTMDLYADCDTEDCIKTPWIVVIAFIILINMLMAFVKETICHQFSQRKNLSAMKDRVYSVVILVYKTLLVALIEFSDVSEKAIIVINFVFAILSLALLYQRFPYINTRTLQMSIIFQTITFAFTFLLMLYLCGLNLDSNSILVFILVVPLLIKMALIKLKIELRQILSLKIDNPYKMLHFPILAQEYFNNIALFPEPLVFNKSTLYGLGITNGEDLEKIRENDQVDALQKQVYSVFAEKILQSLRIKKNNELLMFALADLYSNQLNDMPKALYTINNLRTKDLSFPAKITLDIITAEIEGLHLKPNTNSTEDDSASFSDYFNIRDATTAFNL